MGLGERNKPTMVERGRSRADRDESKRNLPKGKRGLIGRQLRKVRNRPGCVERAHARACYPVRFDRCESTVIRESSRSDLFFSPRSRSTLSSSPLASPLPPFPLAGPFHSPSSPRAQHRSSALGIPLSHRKETHRGNIERVSTAL